MANLSSCDDFLAFQEILKNSRKLDDNIIHALNTTVPTQSFADQKNATETCKDLYGQLQEVYSTRTSAISKCVSVSEKRLKQLREQKDNSPDDIKLIKEIKKEQTKFRLLQSELGVEDVIKDRSRKAFHERCRWFYAPP